MKTKNHLPISWNVISKHRTLLMGFTILNIIFFHFTQDCVNNSYNLKPFIVNYKTYIGSGGVDIFLFLSGFGLYYSFTKNSDLKTFYKKRFSRILITYFLLATPSWFIKDIIIDQTGIVRFIKDLLFITFFENGIIWFWYILMILVCYLIFPYLYQYVNEQGNSISKMMNLFSFVTVIVILIQLYNADFFTKTNIALLRFPAFFAGCFVGKSSFQNKDITPGTYAVLLIAILLLPLKSTSKTFLSRYILAFSGISMIILLAIVLEILSIRKIKSLILERVIEWFGNHSLELYLTHVAIRKFLIIAGYPTYRIRHECLLFILSIICSFILKKASNYVSRYLHMS